MSKFGDLIKLNISESRVNEDSMKVRVSYIDGYGKEKKNSKVTSMLRRTAKSIQKLEQDVNGNSVLRFFGNAGFPKDIFDLRKSEMTDPSDQVINIFIQLTIPEGLPQTYTKGHVTDTGRAIFHLEWSFKGKVLKMENVPHVFNTQLSKKLNILGKNAKKTSNDIESQLKMFVKFYGKHILPLTDF